MLIKNIVGTLIILLNMAGLGYLFFIGIAEFFDNQDEKEQKSFSHNVVTPKKHSEQPVVIDENIIPDEDDLLKDMDLSDLDNLDLDDFE
nr:hypothetical protein [uncultured Desulfobacter sp.]